MRTTKRQSQNNVMQEKSLEGKSVLSVALGAYHTMALVAVMGGMREVYTWGAGVEFFCINQLKYFLSTLVFTDVFLFVFHTSSSLQETRDNWGMVI